MISNDLYSYVKDVAISTVKKAFPNPPDSEEELLKNYPYDVCLDCKYEHIVEDETTNKVRAVRKSDALFKLCRLTRGHALDTHPEWHRVLLAPGSVWLGGLLSSDVPLETTAF